MEQTKNKILIVDDSEFNRALLADILSSEYEILEAENGIKALALLREHETEIALMLLDIVMPEMDGFEVLATMNRKGWIKTVNVIIISAESSSTYIDRAYDLGAVDYISRPFDERTVRHRVSSNYLLSLKQTELSDMLSAQIYEKEKDNSLMIEILSHIVEFRNGESGLHVLHVHTITEMLLKELVKKTKQYSLTNKEIYMIGNASALHDIGKISIPSEILNKPGRFTPEEYEIMKRHTIEGANMLDNIPFHQNEPLVKIAYQICRWHHERYDGRGYPDGLKGDNIPIAAQVVALADVYDALTSKRVYKPAYSPEDAVKMIMNGECGAFNPILLECLKAIVPALVEELSVMTFGHASDVSIRDSVDQILKNDAGDVSNRTVQLLEYERMKFKYLADISREITFEYIAVPEMIKLSDFSSERLGLSGTIMHPSTNKQWNKVFSKDDFNDFINKIKHTTPDNSVVMEKYLLNINGKQKWNKVIAKVLWADEETRELEGAIGKIMDINEETREMQYLEQKAERDAKTGLFNHNAAKARIEVALSECIGRHYLLIMFDLDNFKVANDNYGHLFGDRVLIEVANRITHTVRSSDIAARMGGDEFIVFMEYKDNPEAQVRRVYERIKGNYCGFNISLSMGIACAKDDGSFDFDSLFEEADTAMYVVKRNQKNDILFYDESMKQQAKKPKNRG